MPGYEEIDEQELLGPLARAALEAHHLRDDLMPLVRLGAASIGSSKTASLRERTVRLAYFTTNPELKAVLTNCLKTAAYGAAFSNWIGKRKFRHPTTKQLDSFYSLPPETQKQIHDQWVSGRKQWAEGYKPESIKGKPELTVAEYDQLKPGDLLWVSFRPDHLHEVVGWEPGKKGGKPTLKLQLVSRETGEPVQPGKPRYLHRNIVSSPKHQVVQVPKDQHHGETPKVDWGAVPIEHEWAYLDEDVKSESEVHKSPKGGTEVQKIEDLGVGDYFMMKMPDGQDHLMQVVQKGGVDLSVAPVHADMGVPLGIEPMSLTNIDLAHSPVKKVPPPKPKGGKAVKHTGDVSIGDFLTFGMGGGKTNLLKVQEHTGEYIHAVPINPRNGAEMGDTVAIDSKDLKQNKTWKIPPPDFAEKAKEPKETSVQEVENLFSDLLGEATPGEPAPAESKPKSKPKPKHPPKTQKLPVVLEELEAGHWIQFRDAGGNKRFLHVDDTSGKHPKVTEYGPKGKKYHSWDLDEVSHEFVKEIAKGEFHQVHPPKWSETKLKPLVPEEEVPEEPKPSEAKTEVPSEPPMPAIMQGISALPPPEKPASPKPAGKHKKRPALRGKPRKKPTDKSTFGTHPFVQSMLTPKGATEQEKKNIRHTLENMSYDDWEQNLKRLHFVKAHPEHPDVKEFLEQHSMEDVDHLIHAVGRHLQDVHGRQYHGEVLSIANKHDLEGEDADELRSWARHHPNKNKTWHDIYQRFLKHASPDTKKRMQGMPLDDFVAMYKSILKDSNAPKTAALMRRIASFLRQHRPAA